MRHTPVSYALEHTTRRSSSLCFALKRIRTMDESLCAWPHIADNVRLNSALESGLLYGILFGVKDVIDVRGMPTRCGSEHTISEPAGQDADCVAILRNAGAIPVGKTSTAEFAYRNPPVTNNPAAPGHTPGGSSSGSAAAVAAQMVPFALSTQTGGSIIRPAAYCGTVGFKPSFGLISRNGLTLGCESLDTIGWHAENLKIAHRVASVLLPQDESKDTQVYKSIKSLKILHVQSPAAETPDAEVSNNLRHVCELLRAHGAIIIKQNEDQRDFLDSSLTAHKVIMQYELGKSLAPIVAHHPTISEPVKKLLQATRSISHKQYLYALEIQTSQRLAWDSFTGGADIILAPSAPTPAGIGLQNSGSSAYCRAWTLLGWPCLHIPIGLSRSGLPIGFQIITPWQHDFEAFQAADLIWQICANENDSSLINN